MPVFESGLGWIASNLASAVLGVVAGVLFQRHIERAWARTVRWFKMLFRGRGVEHPKPETFSLGARSFPFLVVDGDGIGMYRPETIRTRLEKPAAPLPLEIEDRKQQILAREELKRARGETAQWNGPSYALRRFAIGRTVPEEDLELTLTFVPSDYFTFQATVMSLDHNLLAAPSRLTLRQKYLNGRDLSQPYEALAQGFGVALAVVTSDHKMIFSWRSEKAGARPGELDVAVVEGVHPLNDRAATHFGPDLYRTAIRGAREEAGLEILTSQVTFLGFGVDTEFYQWVLLGVIRLSSPAQEALESRRRGAGGRWEAFKFDVVSADAAEVFTFLRDKRMWAVGWVATYWALVHEFGRERVDAAAAKILRT